MGKTDIESAFRLIPVHPDDWELLGCSGTGSTILTRCSHLGFALAQAFLTNCPITLSGFYSTNVLFPHHHIKLTTGFYKDIEMWKMFIDQWNGIGLFLSLLFELPLSNFLRLRLILRGIKRSQGSP